MLFPSLKAVAKPVGGFIAMLTAERFNVYAASVIGVLTIVHLILTIRKDVKK